MRVCVTDETNLILDLDGYFIPDTAVTFQGARSNTATCTQNAAVSYNGSPNGACSPKKQQPAHQVPPVPRTLRAQPVPKAPKDPPA